MSDESRILSRLDNIGDRLSNMEGKYESTITRIEAAMTGFGIRLSDIERMCHDLYRGQNDLKLQISSLGQSIENTADRINDHMRDYHERNGRPPDATVTEKSKNSDDDDAKFWGKLIVMLKKNWKIIVILSALFGGTAGHDIVHTIFWGDDTPAIVGPPVPVPAPTPVATP